MFKLNIHLICYLALLAVTAAVVSGCRQHDEPDPPVPPAQVERVVLVYMVANNNLGASGYDSADIEEMLVAARAGDIKGKSRLLVYHDGTNGRPVLVEIRNGGQTDTLARYDGDAYAVETAHMKAVFDDMERLAPADEYGLVLWSHGTGWIQDGISTSGSGDVAPLSFGLDRGRTMNVTELARVIDGRGFSFVYFDCCYMASVETLYELRNVVPVVAASATELPVCGSRYDLNVSCYFAPGEPDIIGAARNTFEYYNSMIGSSRTCTMSVINTEGLESLAAATADIYAHSSRGVPDGYTPQCFSDRSVASCQYFDFRDYVAALCLDSAGAERFDGATAMLQRFDEALGVCVSYAAATPYLWNSIPLSHHCGLSTYILKNTEAAPSTKNYNTLSWYADVASMLK